MKTEKISSYQLFAAAVIFLVLSVAVIAGTAFAREAESGGGSSSVSSSGSASSDSSSSGSVSVGGNSADDMVGGVKLRGDGTVDDDQTVVSGGAAGVDLRGDGTVDDNLPRHSGLDDLVGGVDLRGDGTVEDNSTDVGETNDSGFDSARDILERGGFGEDMHIGSRGGNVAKLQSQLTDDGFFSGPITGTFGEMTREAVMEFQREHGLPETGVVGVLTRGELNKSGPSTSASDDSSDSSDDSSGPSSSSGKDSANDLNDDNSGESDSLMAKFGDSIVRFFSKLAGIFGV